MVVYVLKPSGMKKLLHLGLMLVALAAAFCWGFLAHRQQIFPYGVLRQLMAPDRQVVVEQGLESRSPAFEQLQALAYVEASFDPEAENRGVLLFDRERAAEGLNFYNSRIARAALLIDMEGREVYRWSHPTEDAWQHSELLPNGDLLVILMDRELIRLNGSSSLLWSYRARPHHDLSLLGEEIFVLTRSSQLRPEVHPRRKTLVDSVAVLDHEGVEIEKLSILDAMQRSPFSFLLPSVSHLDLSTSEEDFDLLHTNHVEVFDGSLADRSSLFEAGNMLLSARNINAIFIINRQGDVLWLWGPTHLVYQHHPRLLPNGNILIFNNGRRESELIEMDPLAERIVWRYRREGFFSRSRGSNQRLANGNTLVTESDSGYVFEIDPGGEIVWRFANPDVSEQGERAAIWRMTRFAPEELTFLGGRLRASVAGP